MQVHASAKCYWEETNLNSFAAFGNGRNLCGQDSAETSSTEDQEKDSVVSHILAYCK